MLLDWLFRRVAMSQCPDIKGCRPLAVQAIVDGFMCVGKLREPTDHYAKGINDICLCFRQGVARNRWHMNRNDIIVLFNLFMRAMVVEDKEAKHAVHKAGAEEGGRPGC